ncbi:MAG TPA: PEP/pyruvate-binding domain-containing protein [Kofleriaceae bacterium]|nr:PEP/pyruvate-binding domain-containing protein [Kofleriaceae bacterium]
MKHLALAVALVIASHASARAQGGEQRAWVKEVPNLETWKRYSKTVGSDEFGKAVIDVKTNAIYFIDVNLFNIHADFVLGVLLKQPWTAANVREYNKNYERVKPRFILCYLTHHLKVDKWTFSFWEGDKIGPDDVMRVSKRFQETFFMKSLPFRPDSPMQQAVANDVKKRGLKTITNDEIYKAATFQAFNKGRTVGKLRIVPVGTPFESLTFERTDIVLLQESYPDITPVAGIIASQFSTPLSHVNLRAGAWKIPNAGDKKARDKYGKLDGKVVYYEVTDTAITLREATAAEIKELENKIFKARHVDLPEADTKTTHLAMLTRMRAKDVLRYGTKASNLGEIVTANLEGVRVPPGFGVPFFYYVQHMQKNGLDKKVEELLTNPKFKDGEWRKTALEQLRTAITEAPIDPDTVDMLYKRVRLKLGGKGVFVRSSSNSEDLPGFNGAGLYDTIGNVVGKKQLGEALKKVWASLWNLRAVDERTAFGIDHRQAYMAVLIQVGVNATAAGVLVTKNLWDPGDDHSFTINSKWGLGERVVPGQKLPEQIIFDPTNDGTKIISRADDPVMLVFDEHGGMKELPVPAGAGVILSEERAKKLSNMVEKFMPVFTHGQPLDVEWVLEGEDVWIVQARPYVGS